MDKSKKLIFSFFISAALLNSKFLTHNIVHAAEATKPNIQSSAYSGDLNIFTKYGYKGQCTWFTYGRALEKLGISLPSEFYGNAVDWWYANVKDSVYSYGSEPKANSIAVWAGGNYGYGHVGFVENVEGNNVFLNEGNFSVRRNYDGSVKSLSKDQMKSRGNLYLKGYIYLDSPSKKDTVKLVSNTVQASTSTATIVGKGVVTLTNSDSTLNVRSEPNTSSSILGYLKNSQIVSIVGTYGDWYKIQYGSTYAYVNSKYIISSSNSTQANNAVTTKVLSVKSSTISIKSGFVSLSSDSSSLNLRSYPNGKILTTLKNGTKIDILESTGGWYKVSVSGNIGYVSSSYVNTSQNSFASLEKTTDTTKNKVGVVALSDESSTLNLRNNPWTGRVLSTLTSGSKVEILGSSGRWYKVKSGDSVGYVHSDYIQV